MVQPQSQNEAKLRPEENLGEILQAATTMLAVATALAAILPSMQLLRMPTLQLWRWYFKPVSIVSALLIVYGAWSTSLTWLSILDLLPTQKRPWWHLLVPIHSLGMLAYAVLLLFCTHFVIVSLVARAM